MISKESIFDYARWMALFLRFRRLGPWSSDLPGAVASMRNLGRKVVGLAAFYPVITVFYRVITGFLTFCSDRGKFGLTAPLLGPNYRYRDLPEITGGTYRVC